MRILAIIVIAASSVAAWAFDATPLLQYVTASAGAWKMQIAFAGYTNRTETLTNFPVLVTLSNNIAGSGFTYSGFVTTNGYDLRFYTNSTGTGDGLNYEIESWNTGGYSFVWVQAPAIPGDGSGSIWAKWGNTAASNQLACTTNGATWDSNFKGVWHLATSSKDSTAYAKNGTDTAISYGASYGKIGAGANTTGNPCGISIPSNTFGTIGTGDFTCELWFKPNAPASGNRPLIFGSFSITSPYPGPNIFYDPLQQITSPAGDGVVFRVCGTNAYKVTNPSASSMYATWQHIVYTRQNGTNTAYYNGVSKTNFVDSYNIPLVNTACLLSRPDYPPQCFSASPNNAYGDEFRASTVARSTNWIWACWLNQASNTVFQIYGGVTQ